MNCEQAEKLLPMHLFEELLAETAVELEAHVESCQACRAQMLDLRLASGLARQGASELPEAKLSDARLQALRGLDWSRPAGNKARARPMSRVLQKVRRLNSRYALGAAAVVVLCASLAGLMVSGGSGGKYQQELAGAAAPPSGGEILITTDLAGLPKTGSAAPPFSAYYFGELDEKEKYSFKYNLEGAPSRYSSSGVLRFYTDQKGEKFTRDINSGIDLAGGAELQANLNKGRKDDTHSGATFHDEFLPEHTDNASALELKGIYGSRPAGDFKSMWDSYSSDPRGGALNINQKREIAGLDAETAESVLEQMTGGGEASRRVIVLDSSKSMSLVPKARTNVPKADPERSVRTRSRWHESIEKLEGQDRIITGYRWMGTYGEDPESRQSVGPDQVAQAGEPGRLSEGNESLLDKLARQTARVKELESTNQTLRANYREYLSKHLEAGSRAELVQNKPEDAISDIPLGGTAGEGNIGAGKDASGRYGGGKRREAGKSGRLRRENESLLDKLARQTARVKELETTKQTLRAKYRKFLSKQLEAGARAELAQNKPEDAAREIAKRHARIDTTHRIILKQQQALTLAEKSEPSVLNQKIEFENELNNARQQLHTSKKEKARMERDLHHHNWIIENLNEAGVDVNDLVFGTEGGRAPPDAPRSGRTGTAEPSKPKALPGPAGPLSDLDRVRRELAQVNQAKARVGKDLGHKNWMIEKLLEAGVSTSPFVFSSSGNPAPAIDGRVLAVRKDVNLVMLSVGKNDGVKQGYKFTIYRGDKYIGKIEIEKVFGDMASARIIPSLTQDEIVEGDGAATRIYGGIGIGGGGGAVVAESGKGKKNRGGEEKTRIVTIDADLDEGDAGEDKKKPGFPAGFINHPQTVDYFGKGTMDTIGAVTNRLDVTKVPSITAPAEDSPDAEEEPGFAHWYLEDGKTIVSGGLRREASGGGRFRAQRSKRTWGKPTARPRPAPMPRPRRKRRRRLAEGDEAVRVLNDEAARAAPTPAERATASEYYEKVGRKLYGNFEYERAQAVLKKAAELDPGNKQAGKYLRRTNDVLNMRLSKIRSAIEHLSSEKKVAIQDQIAALENNFYRGQKLLAEVTGKDRTGGARRSISSAEGARKLDEAIVSLERAHEIIKWMPYHVDLSNHARRVKATLEEARRARKKIGPPVAQVASGFREADATPGPTSKTDPAERIRRAAPTPAEHAMASEYYKIGRKLYDSVRYERARELFQKAVELNPDDKVAAAWLRKTDGLLGLRVADVREALGQLSREKRVKPGEKLVGVQNALSQAEGFHKKASEEPGKGRGGRGGRDVLASRIRNLDRAIKRSDRVLEIIKWMPFHVDLSATRDKARKLRDQAKKEKKQAERKLFVEGIADPDKRISRAAIPHSRYLVYPPNWEDISKRSSEQAQDQEAPEWKRDIRKKMQKKVSFEFIETPLSEVIESLQSRTGVNIVLDPQAFEAGGDREMPITLKVKNMSGELALKWVLKLAELDHTVKDQAILVSTPQNLAVADVDLVIYDVRDLTLAVASFPGPEILTGAAQSGGGPVVGAAREEAASAGNLAELIRTRFQPDSWAAELGTSIEEHAGKLVVMQRPEVHRKIQALIKNLRKEMQKEKAERQAKATPEKPKSLATDKTELPVFAPVKVNPFVMTARDRLSTFALDTNTASYAIARKYIRSGYLPPPGAVRVEGFVNSFDYNYPTRTKRTFAAHVEAMPSPFRPGLTLLKVGVKGKVIGRDGRKPAHLVLVVDTSGSMARDDRLPLVRYALKTLIRQLRKGDRVSLISYGTGARLVLETAGAGDAKRIAGAIGALEPSGSTNLQEGLKLGYQIARRAFRPGEINRVILLSDGVANIGATDAESLVKQASDARGQGITFTSAGFGIGSYNDAVLQELARRGDGQYVFVDSKSEARRIFESGVLGTLQTIAKDAKVQVEFNPRRVRRYRLLGYESRDIADKDFRNDAVDAGEVGSGQSATALYEIELLPLTQTEGDPADIGTVHIRYRDVDTNKVVEFARRIESSTVRKHAPMDRPRLYLAAAVAELAEILRGSPYVRGSTLERVGGILESIAARLPLDTQVAELKELVRKAKGLPRAPYREAPAKR